MNHSIARNTWTNTFSGRRTPFWLKADFDRALLSSLVYACFVVFFPWDSITKTDGFRDFNRYVAHYDSDLGSKMEMYGLNTVAEYLTSEILWDELVLYLTSITGDAAVALPILSFVIAFIWAIVLFSRIPALWALPFLLHPTSIDTNRRYKGPFSMD